MKVINKIKLLAVSGSVLGLIGCALADSTYYPITATKLSPKKPEEVEILSIDNQPQRAYVMLGKIHTSGNYWADPQKIVDGARAKAAAIGADFIVPAALYQETQYYYNPGYATYQSSASGYAGSAANASATAYGAAYANPYGAVGAYRSSAQGSAYSNAVYNSQASGYSVGPSIGAQNNQAGDFYVGTYVHVRLPFTVNKEQEITKFNSGNAASRPGLKMGDKIDQVAGYSLQDPAILPKMLNYKAGDSVPVQYTRAGQQYTTSAVLLAY